MTIKNPVRNSEGIYHWEEDGVSYTAPSVSTILRPLDDYGHINPEVLKMAQDRGTAIHKATELYDKDELDWESVHSLVAEPLGRWTDFRRRTGFKPIFIEEFVRSKKYRFAGRLDRVGFMPAWGRFPDCIAVLDIKSGSGLPVKLGPQLAGYREAARETVPMPDQFDDFPFLRMVCFLDSDKEEFWDYLMDDDDWNVFMSCSNIYHYKRRKR